MTPDEIRAQVHQFVVTNFLFDEKKKVDENQSLLGSGIIDSTGILELIGFLEEKFAVRFEDQELVSDNFDSIACIESFITRKLASAKAG